MVDIKLLSQIGKIKKFSKGQYICKEGQPGNEMYIVLSGTVEVYVKGDDNKQIKISQIKEGDFFGEMSVIDNQPRNASVICSVDTILCSIDSNNFVQLISKQPQIAIKIIKGLSHRIQSQNNVITELKKKHQRMSNESNLKTIVPDNHKKYNIINENNIEDKLYSKSLICPVCKSTFDDFSPKMSKIKLVKTTPDFRRIYEDIDPLWYSISTCPSCNYVNLQNTFASLNTNTEEAYTPSLTEEQLKDIPKLQYSNPRNIDEVFLAHYAALKCLAIAQESEIKIGKVWLQLSWLYSDVKDADMYDFSTQKSYEAYYNSYYGSHTEYEENIEQQLCMILAELLLKQEKRKDAYLHYQKALTLNKDSKAAISQIRDRISEIRSK